MISLKEEKKRRFIVNFLYLLVILAIAWFVLKYLIGWVAPFIIAFFVAAVVQPIVGFLHKRLRINRKFAAIFMVLLFIIVVGGLLTLLISRLIIELAAVSNQLPTLVAKFTDALNGLSGWFSQYINQLPVEIATKISDSLNKMAGGFMQSSNLSSGAVDFIINIVSRVPGLLLETIITIVASCFMSMDYLNIRNFIMRQMPEKYQSWVSDIKEFFFKTLGKLVKAYSTIMFVTFVELCIGLTLMGLHHSVALALAIAVVDILPVLGTGSVLIPWIIIELISRNYAFGFELLVMYGVILVVRNILEPKLVGYHIGLHPLVTLMSMFIGLNLLGFVGMFLFPITIIIIKHMQDSGKIKLWKN